MNYEQFTDLANQLIDLVNNQGWNITACNNVCFCFNFNNIEISEYSTKEMPTLKCTKKECWEFMLVYYNISTGLDFTLMRDNKDKFDIMHFDFINGVY